MSDLTVALVHRHHNVWDEPQPVEEGRRPESRLEWVWHAHQHRPEHVDTTSLEPLDGTGHPIDVHVRLTPAQEAEIRRQMREFRP